MLKLPKIQVATALTLALFASGCAAKYHTIRKDGPEGASADSNNPVSDDAIPKVAPADSKPTAGVEVIVSGQSVTTVKAGQAFTARPTSSTLDPAAANTPNCRNPGIVTAVYTIGNNAAQTATRSGSDCSDLSVPQTMTTAGTYTVTLVVTASSGKTASASMTLIVTAADGTPSSAPGFVIAANPSVTTPGTDVSFTSNCTDGTVAWQFGDTVAGSGIETTHAYSAAGQYTVAATCTRPDGNGPQSASATVTCVPAAASSTATTGDGGSTGGTGSATTAGSGTGTTGSGTGTTGSSTGSGTGTGSGTTTGSGTGGTTSYGGTGYGTGGKTSPGQTPGQTPTQSNSKGK